MRPSTTRSVVIALLCASVAAGCRFTLLSSGPWDADSLTERAGGADRIGGQASRPAPRTIPVELVFVRCGAHDSPECEELWRLIDEQSLDAGLRRRLAANGLRAGVITGELPTALAERFRAEEAAVADDAVPEPPSERPDMVRRLLRLLPGRESDIVAAAGVAELVLLEHDGEQVRGDTYRDASAHFALRAWPAADGRVRLQLTPTIKHGPLERSWVGEEGVFRMQNGQRENQFESLRLEATVPANATLVVGCAGERASSVGDAFFRENFRGAENVRLLAIRPRDRVIDPLFAPTDHAEDPDDSASLRRNNDVGSTSAN